MLCEQSSGTFLIQSVQVQEKLVQILHTLEQQSEDYKKYYTHRIEELLQQIRKKDTELENMKEKIQKSNQKCQYLQWKVLEKDNIIEDLHIKIKNIQSLFKQKMHHYIDKIELFQNKQNRKQSKQQTTKRINISQYFIKAVQISNTNSKETKGDNVSTKVDNENPSDCSESIQNNNNYVCYNYNLQDNSDPTNKVYKKVHAKTEKRKSLREQQNMVANYQQQFIISASNHNSKKKIQSKKAIYNNKINSNVLKDISKINRQQTGQRTATFKNNMSMQRKAQLLAQRQSKLQSYQRRKALLDRYIQKK